MWHPGNISPVAAWLAAEDCDVTGQVFMVVGGTVQRYQGWTPRQQISKGSARWAVDELKTAMKTLVG